MKIIAESSKAALLPVKAICHNIILDNRSIAMAATKKHI